MELISHVTISLLESPRQGIVQVPVRVTPDDKTDIEAAAKILGMSRNRFIQLVVVQASRKVISEAKSRRGR